MYAIDLIKNFYGLNLISLFFSLILISPVIFLHYNFGNFLLKRGSFYEKCVVGLAFNAIIISILVSYFSILASIYIFLFFIVSLIFFVLKKDFNKIKIKEILLLFLIILILFTLFINSINYKDIIHFNGHQSYYSGIPLEILKSNYFDRLKIFDNFPATWTKYHFFNGSLEALFLFFQLKKNYLTFTLSKISIISLFIFIFYLKIKNFSKLNSIFILIFTTSIIFIIFPNQIKWSLGASSYTSLFFLLISLYNFLKKDYESCLITSSIFTISTSRSLICGIFLIFLNLYFIYKNFSNKDEIKQLAKNFFVPFVIIFFGIFCLVFSGESVNNSSLISLYIGNFYNENWLYLMSPGFTKIDLEYNLSNLSIVKQKYYFYLVFVIFIFWLSLKYNENFFIKFLKNRSIFFISLLTIYFSLLFYLYFIDFYFKKIFLINIYFLLPLFLLVISSKSNALIFSILFYFIAVSCIIILPAGISIANYILIEWIILFNFFLLLFKEIKINVVFKISTCILFGFIFSSYSPLNPVNIFKQNKLDTSTKKIINIFQKINTEKKIHCFKNDNLAAIMSLKGFKVTYSKSKSKRYNVSERFIKNKPLVYNLAKKNCYYE